MAMAKAHKRYILHEANMAKRLKAADSQATAEVIKAQVEARATQAAELLESSAPLPQPSQPPLVFGPTAEQEKAEQGTATAAYGKAAATPRNRAGGKGFKGPGRIAAEAAQAAAAKEAAERDAAAEEEAAALNQPHT